MPNLNLTSLVSTRASIYVGNHVAVPSLGRTRRDGTVQSVDDADATET